MSSGQKAYYEEMEENAEKRASKRFRKHDIDHIRHQLEIIKKNLGILIGKDLRLTKTEHYYLDDSIEKLDKLLS